MSDVLNAAILEQLRFLSEDDPKFVRDIIEGFLAEAEATTPLIQSSDPHAVERLCHKLQGASANVGALAFPNLMQDIRHAVKSDPDRLSFLIGQIPDVLQQTRMELERFMNGL
jgi:HPt (histidine-containing phosphotransfer) domain-containing protein